MRLLILLTMLAIGSGTMEATVRAKSHPYRRHWKKSTFGKGPAARVGAGATLNQLAHRPKQWTGASGFGKRVGSGFATHATKTTVQHVVAAKLHEDLQYHPSRKRGFGPRMKHALGSTFVVRNLKTGKKRPAAGRLSG